MIDVSGAYAVSVAKYLGAGICMAFGGLGTALGQGYIGGKACESIGRRPESAKLISASVTFSIVMTEIAAIFAFVVAMMLLFVV